MKCPVKKCYADGGRCNTERIGIMRGCRMCLIKDLRRAQRLIRNNPLSRCPSRYPTAQDKVIIEVSAKEVLNWKRRAVEIGAMKEKR